jgi:hypothetical protein
MFLIVALKMCTRTLGTCDPSYTTRHARPFFMVDARSPHGTAGRVTARSPPSREAGSGVVVHVIASEPPQLGGKVQSYRTRASVEAHLSREAKSGAIGHVTTSEPTSVGSKVQSHRTCDSVEAHLDREARSGAVGHVIALKHTSVGR